MLDLSAENVVAYLREKAKVSSGEVLIEPLSGGVANVVLKIFDVNAGGAGNCFVLKQPLPKFKTAQEWRVDIERVKVERDSMLLLAGLLPQGAIPEVLWFDEENYVLAISCAPVGSVIWKKALLDGLISVDAATHAGMLLAMIHSSTKDDAHIKARYGDPKFFIQQRVDPYLHGAAEKNPEFKEILYRLGETLLSASHCLIHGDFSPKNIFLVPHGTEMVEELRKDLIARDAFALSHLLLLDFEVVFYGHAGFDVATLINHLVLKAFYASAKKPESWRGFLLMADGFWDTYRHTADPDLVRAASSIGGHLLGALMLARVDGKSPAEYLDENMRAKTKAAALLILSLTDASLDTALEQVGEHLSKSS